MVEDEESKSGRVQGDEERYHAIVTRLGSMVKIGNAKSLSLAHSLSQSS